MKTVQWALSESVNQYLNICRINRNEMWCKSSRFPNGETQWLWWPSDLWFRMKCRPWNIFRSFTANQRCSFLQNSNWSRCWLVLKRKQKNPNKLTWRQLTFKPAWNDVVLRQWKEPGPGISSDAICCNKLFFFICATPIKQHLGSGICVALNVTCLSVIWSIKCYWI